MFGINSVVILPLDTIEFKMPTMDIQRNTEAKNDVKSKIRNRRAKKGPKSNPNDETLPCHADQYAPLLRQI